MAKKKRSSLTLELPKTREKAKYKRKILDIEKDKILYEYEKPESELIEEELDESQIEQQIEKSNAKELILQWQKTKDPELLEKLISFYEPLVFHKTQTFLQGLKNFPPEALKAEVYKLLYNALKTYDPSKGSPTTHIYAQLQPIHRFVATNQNLGRIPENRIFDIGKYQRAVAYLSTVYGTKPTPEQVAKYLGWRVKDVVVLQKSLRKDINIENLPKDISRHELSLSTYLKLASYDMTPQERKILKLLASGKYKDYQISKKLKISQSKFSRIKHRLIEKIREQMNE